MMMRMGTLWCVLLLLLAGVDLCECVRSPLREYEVIRFAYTLERLFCNGFDELI